MYIYNKYIDTPQCWEGGTELDSACWEGGT